jgi:hypothetical protein
MTDIDIYRIVDLEDIDNMVEFGLNQEQKEKAMKYALKQNKTKILSVLLQDLNPGKSKEEDYMFLSYQKKNENVLWVLLRFLCTQRMRHCTEIDLV